MNCFVCGNKMRQSSIDGNFFLTCDWCKYEFITYSGKSRTMNLYKAIFKSRESTLQSSADELAEANRLHRRALRKKRLEYLKANPDDPRHGKKLAYDDGCRCPKCKGAIKRAYAEKVRAKRSVS